MKTHPDARLRPGVSVSIHHHKGKPPQDRPAEESDVCHHLDATWDAFVAIMDELILKVARIHPKPTVVVGLSFAGILIARAISKVLGIRVAFAAVESFGYDPDDFHGHVDPNLDDRIFKIDLLRTQHPERPEDETCVLIVDDHPGLTMKHCERWIASGHALGFKPPHVFTASLWDYEGSRCTPNIFIDWIHPEPVPGTDRTQVPVIQQAYQRRWPRSCLADVRRRVNEHPLPNRPIHEWPGMSLAIKQDPDKGPTPQLHVSWEGYADLIDRFIVLVADWSFNQIVGVLVGAAIQGYATSKALSDDGQEVPVAFIGAEKYATPGQGQRETKAGKDVKFARGWVRRRPGIGNRIVVVDDNADSGDTLWRTHESMFDHPDCGYAIKDVQTAVLIYKSCSIVEPTIYVVKVEPVLLEGMREAKQYWIVWPWELAHDTNTTLEMIAQRVAARVTLLPAG